MQRRGSASQAEGRGFETRRPLRARAGNGRNLPANRLASAIRAVHARRPFPWSSSARYGIFGSFLGRAVPWTSRCGSRPTWTQPCAQRAPHGIVPGISSRPASRPRQRRRPVCGRQRAVGLGLYGWMRGMPGRAPRARGSGRETKLSRNVGAPVRSAAAKRSANVAYSA